MNYSLCKRIGKDSKKGIRISGDKEAQSTNETIS